MLTQYRVPNSKEGAYNACYNMLKKANLEDYRNNGGIEYNSAYFLNQELKNKCRIEEMQPTSSK